MNAKTPLPDNVLLCGKKQERNRFIIWVISVWEIKVEAATIEKAERLLVDEMWKRYDLDEPFAIKYQEAIPGTKSGNILLEIAPNEVADATEPSRYFKNGFCAICQSGQGGRKKDSLTVEHIPKGTKGGVLVRFQPYFKCGMRVGMLLLHQRICEELRKKCNPLLEFREVRIKPDLKSDFYEIIPTKIIPYIVPAAKKTKAGGVCSKCGTPFVYSETLPSFQNHPSAPGRGLQKSPVGPVDLVNSITRIVSSRT